MFENVKSFLVLLFVFVCSASIVLAADQKEDHKQLKDGSCQEPVIIKDNAGLILAAGQQKGERKQDQDRDGSCQEPVIIKDNAGLVLAAGQQKGERKQGQDRDGSCQEPVIIKDDTGLILA